MAELIATTQEKLKVVIVGGGISGLSTAWYLEKMAKAQDISLECTVLEKSERWGGKILTEHVDSTSNTSFVVEAGPDSFLTQKPWALQLARELGLDERLLGTNDKKRHVYVLNKGKPVVLPEGVLLVVPTKFMPFVMSPLISLLGKLRMGLESFIPAKTDDEDETLADFIRRRLGNEALDKIAEPLMSGIYNAQADKQSIMATFPRFRALEKKHGSLTRGMIASRRQRASTSPSPSASKMSMFVSFQGGTEELVHALIDQLQVNLRTGVQVTSIQKNNDDMYQVQLDNETSLDADIVILATPAFATANLVQSLAPHATDYLNQIRYVSTGTVSLAYRASDVPQVLDGFGLVIPSSEKRPINAITVSSTKFSNRAPDDHMLLRVFFGGSRSPESMELDDEALLEAVRNELRTILGIDTEPLFHRIYRWWNANPQYDLGHLERVSEIEKSLPDGLYVTGSPYRGVGMPDCVHQAQQTAEQVISTRVKQRN
jgi:protoporphyrinogen/coproporphyrinogen III oxidase